MSTYEKNIRQTQIEGRSVKYLTSTPETVKVIKNKESLRNCHSQEEPKETGQLNILLWFPGSDPKRTLGRN